jgi:hypothetical protein
VARAVHPCCGNGTKDEGGLINSRTRVLRITVQLGPANLSGQLVLCRLTPQGTRVGRSASDLETSDHASFRPRDFPFGPQMSPSFLIRKSSMFARVLVASECLCRRAWANGYPQTLQRNGSIDAIRTAVQQGRPKCTDIVPGSPLRHFLYKSRGNVQFTMPSYSPYFEGALEKRRYVCIPFYHSSSSLLSSHGLLTLVPF